MRQARSSLRFSPGEERPRQGKRNAAESTSTIEVRQPREPERQSLTLGRDVTAAIGRGRRRGTWRTRVRATALGALWLPSRLIKHAPAALSPLPSLLLPTPLPSPLLPILSQVLLLSPLPYCLPSSSSLPVPPSFSPPTPPLPSPLYLLSPLSPLFLSQAFPRLIISRPDASEAEMRERSRDKE